MNPQILFHLLHILFLCLPLPSLSLSLSLFVILLVWVERSLRYDMNFLQCMCGVKGTKWTESLALFSRVGGISPTHDVTIHQLQIRITPSIHILYVQCPMYRTFVTYHLQDPHCARVPPILKKKKCAGSTYMCCLAAPWFYKSSIALFVHHCFVNKWLGENFFLNCPMVHYHMSKCKTCCTPNMIVQIITKVLHLVSIKIKSLIGIEKNR